MENIQLFNVAPVIPEELRFLEELAYNLWWCWTTDAIELFRRIDPEIWQASEHNPLVFLENIPQKRLKALAEDDAFLSHMQQVQETFQSDVLLGWDGQPRKHYDKCIAYFSLEYGLHESVRLYSGGLGILAGDHLKAASTLELPLVAVGLFYRQGYFMQALNKDGWQQESYRENEVHKLPVRKVLNKEGKDVIVTVPLPEGNIVAQVWKLDVGSIALYLLDTNLRENPPEIRQITEQLYSGDKKMRLCQELLLGIGGYEAVLAAGHEPAVCHMNEGHAAFLSFARMKHLAETYKLDMDEVLEVIQRSSVFTTHTPVPAGNETFKVDFIKPYMDVIGKYLNISPADLMALGRAPGDNNSHELSMTILGLRTAKYRNGVSALHGEVARKMWSHLWTRRHHDEIPIGHITNGVHVASWLAKEQAQIFERYLGPEWKSSISEPEVLEKIHHIPDEDLWRAHELGRTRLVRTVRQMRERSLKSRNATKFEIEQAKSVLDHNVLTIGFARRFATYKRGTLLLRDPERLVALLTDAERPVQLIFAGKAHPADDHGKELIRQIVEFSRRPEVQGKIVFLDNYDIYTARRMVQGVDVWLNTPRRPHEASGTSGMKAAINGVLNVSILDGWWCEGYVPECGWAIGNGEEYDDSEYGDSVESLALYNLLENEVIPMFYDCSTSGMPTQWIKKMKATINMSLWHFSSRRMVGEYQDSYYSKAFADYDLLLANNAERARSMVKERQRIDKVWSHIRIDTPTVEHEISKLHAGDDFKIKTVVHLGSMSPDEVDVEVYFGLVNSQNKIISSHSEAMTMSEDLGGGKFVYQHDLVCARTGRFGFTVRVRPGNEIWRDLVPGYIVWAEGVAL